MKFIKSKEFLYVLLIVLLVIVATILLFFPDAIDNRYPYSYQAIEDKKLQVEGNNATLKSNEDTIELSLNKLKDLKGKSSIANAEALEVRKGIKESDFELKTSSILISLEQRAYENNVELGIAYSLIRHISGSSELNLYDESNDFIANVEDIAAEETPDSAEGEEVTVESKPEESAGEDEPETAIEDTETADKDTETADKDTEKPGNDKDKVDEPVFSSAEIDSGEVYIEGLDSVVIPITVKGSYQNLRNYINYLDKIGMIEPSSVILTSKGNSVYARIILNVFHGEVDL